MLKHLSFLPFKMQIWKLETRTAWLDRVYLTIWNTIICIKITHVCYNVTLWKKFRCSIAFSMELLSVWKVIAKTLEVMNSIAFDKSIKRAAKYILLSTLNTLSSKDKAVHGDYTMSFWKSWLIITQNGETDYCFIWLLTKDSRIFERQGSF